MTWLRSTVFVFAFAVSGLLAGCSGASSNTSTALSLAPSTIALTASPSPATPGSTITLTATVSSNSTAVGTVTFYDSTDFAGVGPAKQWRCNPGSHYLRGKHDAFAYGQLWRRRHPCDQHVGGGFADDRRGGWCCGDQCACDIQPCNCESDDQRIRCSRGIRSQLSRSTSVCL